MSSLALVTRHSSSPFYSLYVRIRYVLSTRLGGLSFASATVALIILYRYWQMKEEAQRRVRNNEQQIWRAENTIAKRTQPVQHNNAHILEEYCVAMVVDVCVCMSLLMGLFFCLICCLLSCSPFVHFNQLILTYLTKQMYCHQRHNSNTKNIRHQQNNHKLKTHTKMQCREVLRTKIPRTL